MRDFVDRFNRCAGKIPQNSQPSENNQLCVFIAAMQTEIKFLLLRLKVQTLQDAQRSAISLDDDTILSGMKCKDIAQEGINLCEKQNCLEVKPKQKRLILKAIKSTPPIYQSLTVFNDKDLQIPPVSESTSCSVAGAYHLHVESKDEYVSQSSDSMISLDVPSNEQGLQGGRSNENLSEDVSNVEFDSFIFGTAIDISSNDVIQEGMKDQHTQEKIKADYELFLFDHIEMNEESF